MANIKKIKIGNTEYNIKDDVSGYTSNIGTVTSVNNTSPDANGNVTLSIPSQASDIGAQETLVSGTNIKTINNTSLLGSGDISVITDISGKADVDLTNVNNSGTSRGASWAMPSNAYEDLTLGASATTYVAPANGWVLFSRYATDNSYGWTILGVLKENQTTVSDANVLYRTDAHTNTQSTGMTCFMPVKKGQTFFIAYGGASANLLWFRFIYAVGSESEAS